MLFLDRIEILGFKSFSDKTTLKIYPGITSIVGPNGCGKSNVVDALNWVLGEQSAKSLRSDKMEEVIFTGSKNRKPVNMAQVTLIWKTERDNPTAPEVTIARRLFRSGDSQYEMNGEICRLKDIHGFFLNEGFDPLAYSIIEQGRINFLFESKPIERRGLIEEVAGVAEFKHKKRSAQMKLAENQLQLERIQDILMEVEKQLSSLKRQAAKARRYQLLKEEKGTLQRIIFIRKFHQIQEDRQRLEQQLANKLQEEEHALQSLQQQELVLNEKKLRFAEIESWLFQEQSALHQIEMQIQENQSTLQYKRQRISELRNSIQEKETEITRFSQEEINLKQTIELKTVEESELKAQTDELVQHHTQLFTQLDQKTNEANNLEQRVQQLRKEILDLLSSASQLKNEQTRLHTQHEHLVEFISKKETELQNVQNSRQQFMDAGALKRSTGLQIEEELGYLDQTKAEIHQRCDQYKVEWDTLQGHLQDGFKRQQELRMELQKLEAQQHSSKFYNESARDLSNRPSAHTMGMMMDFIQTDPQYETALENFLADKLNYLIVNEESNALSSIDLLKQEGLGYCGFVIKNGHDINPPQLPDELRREAGVIGTLRENVAIRDEALPAVAPFIETAVLVDNLESAQGLIKRYPDFQFVTVQGDVILSPTVYAGGAKADDMPGLISIQRQMKELSVELEAVDQHVTNLENQVRVIQDRLDVSNRELVRLTEVRDSKNKDRMMVQMETDQLEKEISRESNIVEALTSEIALLVSEREAVHARSEQFLLQLQQETSKREECELQFQEDEQQLEIKRREQSDLQVRVHESRIQIAELKERDRAAIAEIDRLKQQHENVLRAIDEGRQIVRQREQEISETENVCVELEQRQIELLRRRDDQKQSIASKESEKEILAAEITTQNTDVQEARTILETVRQERTQTEIEKARTDTQQEDLLLRCREEMGIELDELQLPESEFLQLNEEELRNRMQETEKRIERLGSINELALEEYVQMEERHRFLKTQYDDLRVSIETLLETIKRIDETSLRRFREAYDAVQGHFQNFFQRLFNGGKSEMVLIDPENVHDSGIDIHVQPPGKRLQNVNLLSGGEKALSGIAFLMALFQYNASPFCVMDEVDAALDEVNVQRFLSVISEMKKQIQFIVVTHQKGTMEAADQLYGVTMAEPGVSTVLSAKFEEAQALIQ
jgi:chromosome segregation protein